MPLDAHDDAVAVQRLLEVRCGHVNVALRALDRPLRGDEPEPGRVPVEPADDEIHSIGEAIAVAAHEHEGAIGDQRRQVPLHGRAFFARDLEHANELAGGRRVVHPFAHLAQELVAGRHA